MSARLPNGEAIPTLKMSVGEVSPEPVVEHCAVKAWSQLGPERTEPTAFEVLKLGRKSAVYRLKGVGKNGSDVIAKRCPAGTAEIERAVYDELLPRLAESALRCYGVVKEPNGGFGWLFLEEAGRGEYSPYSHDHRTLAGHWLGAIQRAARQTSLAARLPRRDPNHYLELLRSVREKVCDLLARSILPEESVSVVQTIASQCDIIESHWNEVEDLCGGLPETVVHGDLVVKNVRVRTTPAGPAFIVFDWKNAGWGVPATDFAQFTGRTVSPDCAAYCSTVERWGTTLDLRVVRRLAECGRIFRLIDTIAWACEWGVHDRCSHLEKPIALLNCYSIRLGEALRSARWGESGGHARASRLIDDTRICQTLGRIATRVAANPALQDDLLQECLIRLWKLEVEKPGRTRSWYLQNCRFHLQHWLTSGRSVDSLKRINSNQRLTIDTVTDAVPLDGYHTNGDLIAEVCARDIVSTLASHLKPQERDVLQGLADGLRLTEIAAKFRLSFPTVQKYRRKIAALTIQLGLASAPRKTEHLRRSTRAKSQDGSPVRLGRRRGGHSNDRLRHRTGPANLRFRLRSSVPVLPSQQRGCAIND